ncbi:MAG: class I SAM-dependent rRNA methyltransferase [Opitutales bacterium]
MPSHEDIPQGSDPIEPWVQIKYFNFSQTIYPNMLHATSKGITPGSLVNVYDPNGDFFGTGFFNESARMPLRVVHHGSYPIGEIDLDKRVEACARFRTETLGLDSVTDAYRVIHGNGDNLSGLIVDRYGDTLVAHVSSLPVQQRLTKWLGILHEILGTQHTHVEIDSSAPREEGLKPSKQTVRNKIKITENGVKFEVDFSEGHKTGFFCDQRENRKRLTAYTEGKRVLDLCCYTGGFSVYAATLGNAASVTGVDLDEKAIAQAKRNANMNQISPKLLKFTHADAFSYTRQMQRNGEQFDIVIADPPKFVATRHGEDAERGRRRYNDINQLASSLVAPGGMLVTFSCSGLLPVPEFEKIVIGAAHKSKKKLQVFEYTGPGRDHPAFSNAPESRYLKAIWARVL